MQVAANVVLDRQQGCVHHGHLGSVGRAAPRAQEVGGRGQLCLDRGQRGAQGRQLLGVVLEHGATAGLEEAHALLLQGVDLLLELDALLAALLALDVLHGVAAVGDELDEHTDKVVLVHGQLAHHVNHRRQQALEWLGVQQHLT